VVTRRAPASGDRAGFHEYDGRQRRTARHRTAEIARLRRFDDRLTIDLPSSARAPPSISVSQAAIKRSFSSSRTSRSTTATDDLRRAIDVCV